MTSHEEDMILGTVDDHERRINELEKQVEALRKAVGKYIERKETFKLWGRKK